MLMKTAPTLSAGPVVSPTFDVEDRGIMLGEIGLPNPAQRLLPGQVRSSQMRCGRRLVRVRALLAELKQKNLPHEPAALLPLRFSEICADP
jgi:hypothetical protein